MTSSRGEEIVLGAVRIEGAGARLCIVCQGDPLAEGLSATLRDRYETEGTKKYPKPFPEQGNDRKF